MISHAVRVFYEYSYSYEYSYIDPSYSTSTTRDQRKQEKTRENLEISEKVFPQGSIIIQIRVRVRVVKIRYGTIGWLAVFCGGFTQDLIV